MALLRDKVVAITGAASGIGLALTKLAAQHGAKLALADIDMEKLDEIIHQIKASDGLDATATRVNVAQRAEVDSWIEETVKHFGKLDGAANLAGVEAHFAPVQDIDDEEWNSLLSVNLTGLMYCLRAELRVMSSGGSIVNASSVAGMMGRQNIAPYSATKHAVVGLTKTAAKECGTRRIRVNAIAPGPIMTPMLQRALQRAQDSNQPVTESYNSVPLGRVGNAEEVANLLIFLLSDTSSYITGVVLPVDGGFTA